MKRFLGLLAIAVLGAAAPPPVMQEIIAAEHARQLDGLGADLDLEPLVAARAALAIGRTKDPKGAPALRAHLGVADPAERAMVVYGLGLLADRAPLAQLARLARTDENSAVRYAAADAVGRIAVVDPTGAAPSANDLEVVAEDDRDAGVRGHAAANLDAFRATKAAQGIAFALQRAFGRERDPDVRWHIMWTLSRAYPAFTSRAFFVKALSDQNDIVRLEAVRGLGRQKDRNAAAVITPLLKDPSWRVQEEATEALRRLDGKPPTDHLAALQDGLHLPPLPHSPVADAAPLPRPAVGGSPAPPAAADLRLEPPLSPTTAALMDGPMPGPHPRVRVTTTQGAFVLRLYPEWAPYTVANFLGLANAGFFDGNRWFRIVPDFVVQTGDRTNTGDHDAGYTIGAEENPIEQRAGIIAMGLDYDEKTNTPKRDSAGSQFYITLSPQLHLDRDFSVFGEVQSGFDVLPHLVESDTIRTVQQIDGD
jgi:peptidyl-prolyl cis-trans isomerase B (cyclophilin B)